MKPRAPVIGLDFDNTIICYDELLFRLAVDLGFLKNGGGVGTASGAGGGSAPGAKTATLSKMDLRDEIRKTPGGELNWQKLQALAYGQKIGEARLFDGVKKFIEVCRQNNVPVFIVSHKTETPAADPSVNLRQAALSFVEAQGFFRAPLNFDLKREIFFEPTREAKIKRIAALGCTWFIDDLRETLLEKSFPAHVNRILFSPALVSAPAPGIRVMGSWREINDFFFS